MSTFTISIQYCIGVSSQKVREENKFKKHQIAREEVKLDIFTNELIVYADIPRNLQEEKLLEILENLVSS